MYPSVIAVKALKDYKLELKFANSETRIFDISPYLELGRFKELKDQEKFSEVFISFDTIQWSNGIDLDPELLYNSSNIIEN